MPATAASLKSIGLFQKIPAADLEALAGRCRWRRYDAHEQIIHFQNQSREVYFIIEGKVRATIYSVDGKEVTYRDLGAGDMFGELAAIDGGPRSADVIAIRPSFLASMSDSCFQDVLHRFPCASDFTMKRLSEQVRSLTQRVFEFSTLAVRNRIQAELLRLARENMQDDRIAIIKPAPKHMELASRISTHREAVTRELNDLARSGLLKKQNGSLVINDVPHLARMVQAVLGDT